MQLKVGKRRLPFESSGLRAQLASTAALTVVGSALGLASQAIIARLVGEESFGRYSFVLGIVGLTQVWLALDFGQTIVRFVPGYWRTQDYRLVGEVHSVSLQIVGATTVVGVLLVTLSRSAWINHVSSPIQLALAFALAVGVTTLQLNYLMLVAIGDTRRAVLLQQVLRPTLIAALVATGVWLSLPGEYVVLVSALIGVLVIAFLAHHEVSQAIDALAVASRPQQSRQNHSLKSTWLRFSSTFLPSSAAQGLISSQLDVVLVGAMIAARESGIYAAASHLALVAGLLPSVMNSVLTPRIAAAYDTGTTEETREALSRFACAQLLAASLGLLCVSLIGPLFLGLYGDSFARSYPVALLLSLAGAVSSGLGAPASMVLSTMGGHRKLAVANVSIAILAVVASITLVEQLGSLGAALATLATAVVRSWILQVVARKHSPRILSYSFAWKIAQREIRELIT